MHAKKAIAESMTKEGQQHAMQFIYAHLYVFLLYTIKAKIRHSDLSLNLLIS